jgi:protein ImuB
MRLACLHAPALALQAVLRRDLELREQPVALASGPGERARITALTERARRAGVRRGLTVSQARAASTEALTVVPSSAPDTAAAAAALADVGYGFAPRVESEGERIFVEVGELGRLFETERGIAQAMAAMAARVGVAVRVGIASSKPIARVAAAVQDVAIVPAGGEAAFLAPLPLRAALNTNADAPPEERALAERLERWGLRTFGALAALPVAEVTLRLGPRGAWLHRLATGSAEEAFAPRLPPDALEETTELDYALYEIEPLVFLLRGLLDRALTRLTCRGLACAGLGLRLKLDPRGFDVRDIPLSAPTRDTATLRELVRLDLARRPPASPVVGISALVLPARVRAVELDLWRPSGPAPEKLDATLARLAALCGPDNVGAPAVVDSYREEVVTVRRFQLAPAGEPATAAPSPQPALGFRRFRPPRPLEVLMDRDGPSALRGPEIAARVMVAAGPYRASGQWWSEESFSRDYWDVQATDGAVYRLHQDRTNGAWFLDGYYD